jgi:hypothetical protein
MERHQLFQRKALHGSASGAAPGVSKRRLACEKSRFSVYFDDLASEYLGANGTR